MYCTVTIIINGLIHIILYYVLLVVLSCSLLNFVYILVLLFVSFRSYLYQILQSENPVVFHDSEILKHILYDMDILYMYESGSLTPLAS